MTKPARYTVTYGLSGCYMPDTSMGAIEFDTRKSLASFIRSELEQYDMPAMLFRDVKLSRLWRFIQANGSSVAHFSLTHKGYELAFQGLTDAEFEQANDEA